MITRLKLLLISMTSGAMIVLVLCLGSQNLSQKSNLNLGIGTTAPLPNGFIVGIAIALGVVSGGSTLALLVPTKYEGD